MFGIEPGEQQAYEERHPVYAPFYVSENHQKENEAREHARKQDEAYRKSKR